MSALYTHAQIDDKCLNEQWFCWISVCPKFSAHGPLKLCSSKHNHIQNTIIIQAIIKSHAHAPPVPCLRRKCILGWAVISRWRFPKDICRNGVNDVFMGNCLGLSKFLGNHYIFRTFIVFQTFLTVLVLLVL